MSNVSDKDGSDKDLPDEQQLDDYLRGGSAVSQQYRQLRSADVPAELDRLVLRQAQEAVKTRPAKSRTWVRWAGPLALAASTVLVVSIVIESGVHKKTYLTVPASAPAEMAAKQEAPHADEAHDKATAGSAADASVVHILPVEIEPAPAPFVPPPAPIDVPEPRVERELAIRQSEPPAALARDQRLNSTGIAMPAPAPAPVPARALARARAEDTTLQEAVVTAQKRREQKQSAGPRNTVAAPAVADSASNADEQADQPRNYSDPEQWLRDIRQLRKENKHEEADREWRRFRYVFPDYEVAEADAARAVTR